MHVYSVCLCLVGYYCDRRTGRELEHAREVVLLLYARSNFSPQIDNENKLGNKMTLFRQKQESD